MAFIDNRLRMLLEQNLVALQTGTLNDQMMRNAELETLAYKEPYASDIRILISGLSVERNSSAQINQRLQQALRILHLSASY